MSEQPKRRTTARTTRQPRKTGKKTEQKEEVVENKTFEELCLEQDTKEVKQDESVQVVAPPDDTDEPTEEEVEEPVNKHLKSMIQNDRQGKTYSRNEINTHRNHNTYRKQYEHRQTAPTTCLDFSYEECLNDNDNKTMKNCNIETHLKYLIALTYREGQHKRALCNVLKNTLSGLNGETNLPLLTNDNERRKPYNPDRRPQHQQHRSTSVRQRRNYNE